MLIMNQMGQVLTGAENSHQGPCNWLLLCDILHTGAKTDPVTYRYMELEMIVRLPVRGRVDADAQNTRDEYWEAMALQEKLIKMDL